MKYAVALLCLPLALSFAHADPILWSFDSTKSSFSVTGDAGNLGGVSFAALTGSSSDSKTVQVLNVVAATSPVAAHTDTYSGNPYSVVVDVTDTKSGDVGEFGFTGRLSGSVSPTSASLTSPFDDPQTVHHTLGGHDYAVTIGPFDSPASPDVKGGVSVAVAIDAASTGSPPPVTGKAPEPSGVVLTALAVIAGGGMIPRRRRAAVAQRSGDADGV